LDTNIYIYDIFPVPAKRRKCRPPTAEEEETTAMDAAAAGAVWTPRPLNDLKISSIYNRSATEAPAEVSLKLSCNIVHLSCGCLLHNVIVQPFGNALSCFSPF
jgi:hypothetical protein